MTRPKHLQERRELLALMDVLPLTADIAEGAAGTFTALRQVGVTVDNEDIVMAATAIAGGLPVLTANARRFRSIPGIVLAAPEGPPDP